MSPPSPGVTLPPLLIIVISAVGFFSFHSDIYCTTVFSRSTFCKGHPQMHNMCCHLMKLKHELHIPNSFPSQRNFQSVICEDAFAPLRFARLLVHIPPLWQKVLLIIMLPSIPDLYPVLIDHHWMRNISAFSLALCQRFVSQVLVKGPVDMGQDLFTNGFCPDHSSALVTILELASFGCHPLWETTAEKLPSQCSPVLCHRGPGFSFQFDKSSKLWRSRVLARTSFLFGTWSGCLPAKLRTISGSESCDAGRFRDVSIIYKPPTFESVCLEIM